MAPTMVGETTRKPTRAKASRLKVGDPPDPESDGASVVLLDDEEVIRRPARQAGLDSLEVEAKVVYLGGNTHKSVYFPGQVDQNEDEDGRPVYTPKFNHETGTAYDFSRVDTKGRLIRDRLTKDGRIFSICRHIGHLARFMEAVDEDGAPVFELRSASPAVRLKIERYLRLVAQNETRQVDRGRPVLAAMGLE